MVEYGLRSNAADVVGVIVESDPSLEAEHRRHFQRTRQHARLFVASILTWIPGKAFAVKLVVLVTERVQRVDLDLLLDALVECLRNSGELMALLY